MNHSGIAKYTGGIFPLDLVILFFQYFTPRDGLNLLLTCKAVLDKALLTAPSMQPWANGGLYHACKHGHLEYLKKWGDPADKRWDPNCNEEDVVAGRLPPQQIYPELRAAVENNYFSIVQWLLQTYEFKLLHLDKQLVLEVLCDERQDMLQLLAVCSNMRVDEYVGDPLTRNLPRLPAAIAAIRGQPLVTRFLIDRQPREDIPFVLNKVLKHVIHSGQVASIKLFLANEMSFDNGAGEEALQEAARSSSEEKFQTVLQDPRLRTRQLVRATPDAVAHPNMLKLLINDPRYKQTKEDHNIFHYSYVGAIKLDILESLNILLNYLEFDPTLDYDVPCGYSSIIVRPSELSWAGWNFGDTTKA